MSVGRRLSCIDFTTEYIIKTIIKSTRRKKAPDPVESGALKTKKTATSIIGEA
jgi:hypothetical protein